MWGQGAKTEAPKGVRDRNIVTEIISSDKSLFLWKNCRFLQFRGRLASLYSSSKRPPKDQNILLYMELGPPGWLVLITHTHTHTHTHTPHLMVGLAQFLHHAQWTCTHLSTTHPVFHRTTHNYFIDVWQGQCFIFKVKQIPIRYFLAPLECWPCQKN